jgi:hypothetical protein
MKTFVAHHFNRLLPRLIARLIVVILSMPTGHWEADCTLQAPQQGPIPGVRPTIEIVTLSHQPNQDLLSGRVSHVDVSTHYVAVYVFKPGAGWSIQPSVAQPRILIRRDSSWRCRVRSSGSALKPTAIRAYMLPDSFSPPLLEGAQILPASLDSAAVACTEHRSTENLLFERVETCSINTRPLEAQYY